MSEKDVKIYVSKKELNKSCEIAAAVIVVRIHRAVGNIEKARRLGEALATISPTADGENISVNLREHLAPKFFNQDILYQIKVLLVFACETLIQLEIPVSILSTAALTAMYEKIEKQSPGFYKNISNGAAFTFYYLALQKKGDLAENMGEAFAMLCSVKNKDSFVAAGKTVWNLAVDLIAKEIEKCTFEEVAF